jgi:serine/threonine-protein kinase
VFLVVLLLVVGGIVAFFALRGSGGGNEQRAVVPHVVGAREPDARRALAQRGFSVDVVREQGAQPPGIVVDQRPGGGSRINRGSRVTITVSTGQAQTQTRTQTVTSTQTVTTGSSTVSMPDLGGAAYPDAVERLLGAGLLPDGYPVDSSEDRGTVVDQQPGPGTSVDAGSGVRLDVSLGQGDRAQRDVPDLTGMAVGRALEACAHAGFTCKTTGGATASTSVASQEPAAASRAPELAQITLATSG